MSIKFNGRQSLAIVGLLFFLYNSCFPLAASAGDVLLSNLGSGQWQISVSGLSNVQGIDLLLGYDSQRLRGLTISTGAGLTGVLSAINDKVPGVIRLGAIASQPVPQNGVLLTLKSSVADSELVVTNFIVKTFDKAGKPVATTIRQHISNPDATPQSNDLPTELSDSHRLTTPATTVESRTNDATVTSRRTGIVTLPANTPTPAATSPLIATDATLPLPIPPASSMKAAAISIAGTVPASSGPEKRFHSQEDIVAVIEYLPKPWTVAAIKTVFLKPASACQVRQEPPVALADGKSRVKLYLPQTISKRKPDLAAQGIALGTVWETKGQEWQVDLVTKKDTWPATVLLLGEADLIRFAVVIVPVLSNVVSTTSDETTVPKIDFDGDGKVTATDAYLFVGNLLAQEKVPSARRNQSK